LCPEVFGSAEDLFKHVSLHIADAKSEKMPFLCRWSDCDKQNHRKDHLVSHIRVHIPHRPYKCKVCGKAFKRSNDTREHELIHQKSGEKKPAVRGRRSSFKHRRFNYSMDERMFSASGMSPSPFFGQQVASPVSHMRSVSMDNSFMGLPSSDVIGQYSPSRSFSVSGVYQEQPLSHSPSNSFQTFGLPNKVQVQSNGSLGIMNMSQPSPHEPMFFNFSQPQRLATIPTNEEAHFTSPTPITTSYQMMKMPQTQRPSVGHRRGLSFS
jgi:hypothetical protein